MSNTKIVFVQCEDEDTAELGKCLSQLPPDFPYVFFIAPKSFTALSKEEVLTTLKELTSRVSKNE